MNSRRIYLPLALQLLVVSRAEAQATPGSGETFGDWLRYAIEGVEAGSRVFIYVFGALGIILVAHSVFRLATEQDERDKPKHIVAIAIGSLMTIIGVIIGFFSNLVTG